MRQVPYEQDRRRRWAPTDNPVLNLAASGGTGQGIDWLEAIHHGLVRALEGTFSIRARVEVLLPDALHRVVPLRARSNSAFISARSQVPRRGRAGSSLAEGGTLFPRRTRGRAERRHGRRKASLRGVLQPAASSTGWGATETNQDETWRVGLPGTGERTWKGGGYRVGESFAKISMTALSRLSPQSQGAAAGADRKADIMLLVHHFPGPAFATATAKKSSGAFRTPATEMLVTYQWAGQRCANWKTPSSTQCSLADGEVDPRPSPSAFAPGGRSGRLRRRGHPWPAGGGTIRKGRTLVLDAIKSSPREQSPRQLACLNTTDANHRPTRREKLTASLRANTRSRGSRALADRSGSEEP